MKKSCLNCRFLLTEEDEPFLEEKPEFYPYCNSDKSLLAGTNPEKMCDDTIDKCFCDDWTTTEFKENPDYGVGKDLT